MTRMQSAPGAMPGPPASTGADSDGSSGRIAAFDRHTRARLDGRAGAAPAVPVLIAGGQALVRACARGLLLKDTEPAELLPKLIVEAVDPEDTGPATGINTVTRSIDGAVFAGVLSSTLVGGAPGDHAFTVSFTIGAVALGVVAAAALAVPGSVRARDVELGLVV